MINQYLKYSCYISLLLSLVACKPDTTPVTEDNNAIEAVVLATVNGEDITQDDVNFAIERTFSVSDQLFVNDALKEKVLHSLITSKAMQQTMQQSLSEQALALIESKTQAYKEELFIKEYLLQHATPVPVSTKMVEDYYNEHQDEFGGGQSRTFEMLKMSKKPTELTRDQLLNNMNTIKTQTNWKQSVNNELSTFNLVYYRSKMQAGLLEPALENTVNTLAKGETSEVIFIKEIPHIIRVLEVETLAAKPLAEVSTKIRKKLASLALREAVKKASDEVTKQANIAIIKNNK